MATSSLWLSFFADEEDVATTPTPAEGQALAAGSEGTPTPTGELVSAEEILAGGGMATEAVEVMDPIVAELLRALQQEQLGVGDQPYIIFAGDFVTIDGARRASGVASIWQIGESRRVLRLDPFDAATGPDLRVLLSQASAPRTSAEALLPEYVDLGPLQSLSGAQNYALPESTAMEAYNSVVIFSISLNLVYSTATLEEVRAQ